MHWIALQWLPEEDEDAEDAPASWPSPEVLGWWALRYTPRVAWLDEALLLEVSACERLWGGRQSLMRLMASENPVPASRLRQAQGASSLVALARLRLYAAGQRPPAQVPAALPLETLSAARPHLDVLARLGCRCWGDAAALPRGGFARRFGAPLREALDVAWALQPDHHVWLQLPQSFEQKLELPALAESAAALMGAANRLLGALQLWLRARQRGVLAVELQWTLDLKRCNGVRLPPHEQTVVRTAEPTQDMAHLRRLIGERLARTALAAPASWLRLRSVDTAPWAGASRGFLPDDSRKGDRLHELVERLSARLGPQQVLRAVARADHRPECRQAWQPALGRPAAPAAVPAPQDLSPPWLLREPMPLEMQGEWPCYRGTLRTLAGPQRVETGWWGGGQSAVRDYFIAESPGAGLVWVFRERPSSRFSEATPRWFLQGLYG